MPCAVTYENKNNIACQFDDFRDNDLIDFDQRKWCLLHLPLESPSGEKSNKANWGEGESKTFSWHIAQLLQKTGVQPANLNYVIFHQDFAIFDNNKERTIDRLDFRIEFKNAIFYGNVYLDNTRFLKGVDFGGAIFKDLAKFRNCVFQESATVNNVIFEKQAIFINARFKGALYSRHE